MVTLRFEDPDGRAVVDATVGILRAPGDVHDITINTDATGQIRLDLSEPGRYEFFVMVGGVAHTVAADLRPDEGAQTLVVR